MLLQYQFGKKRPVEFIANWFYAKEVDKNLIIIIIQIIDLIIIIIVFWVDNFIILFRWAILII